MKGPLPEGMPRPQIISWNLTRRCNLACQHCYLDASPFSQAPGELNTEECLAIIDQIAALSPGALLILSGGEPLLRPDLLTIARYAADRGLVAVLGTNGTLVTKGLVNELVASGVAGVGVSIDSLDPATHDSSRRVSGSWQRAVRSLEALKRAGLPFTIQTTVMAQNYAEVAAIARFAFQRGARAINFYFLVPTGRGRYVSSIAPRQYEALLELLAALQAEYQGALMVNAKCAPQYQRLLLGSGVGPPWQPSYQGAGGCPAAIYYCGITPTGDVVPCPYLPIPAGNLREGPLAEIWQRSDLLHGLRQRTNLGGRCGVCDFREACGGCRARAFGALANPVAEDPLCSYQPVASGVRPVPSPREGAYGLPVSFKMAWTAEAQERMERVPAILRGLVIGRVEAYARGKGCSVVTVELVREAREASAKRSLGLRMP